MTRAEFIEKNKHLFWYIKKDKIQAIGNEVLVEFIFNYGTLEDVKQLIKIIGFQELKLVYDATTGRKIGNYMPEIFKYLELIVKKYAP